MRRSICAMLTGLAGLSTAAAAQQAAPLPRPATRAPAGGWTGGLAYTVGSDWQLQGFDVGYAHVLHAGPLRVATVTARLGEFVNQGAIIGGSRGFVGGASFAVRTAMAPLADVGSDSAPNRLGVDVTLEATAYGGAHSPLPEGAFWGAVSVLPGVRLGNPTAGQFALLVGPTVFVGPVTQARAFLGVRYEARLARGEPSP